MSGERVTRESQIFNENHNNKNIRSSWVCKIEDSSALYSIEPQKFQDDILIVSEYLSVITKGYVKPNIELTFTAENCYYDVLEKMGCIKVKLTTSQNFIMDEHDQYVINISYTSLPKFIIENFDIEKIQKLKPLKLDIDEINKRYEAADKSKPLFEQIIQSAISPLAEVPSSSSQSNRIIMGSGF